MALIIVVYVLLFLFFRPCVFVVLDTGNRIHLWDLGVGDIYPVHGVEFDDKVRSFAWLTSYNFGYSMRI